MCRFCRVIVNRPVRSKVGSKAATMACAVVIAMLAGCVPAESMHYRGTMSRSVEPERTAAAEVAGAFGLDEGDTAAIGLAAAGD